jgi:S1-C subfamily serine protease
LITANIDSGANATNSGSSTSSNDSATLLIRSTVQIVVSDGASVCWSGSGTFIGDGTRVLTNAHVAVGESGASPSCNQIQIGITTKASAEPSEFFAATVESVDRDHDLAVLEIEGVKAGQYPVLKVRSEELSIDEPIRVIGYPGLGGNTITLTNGVISGFDDRFDGQYYKVSASISGGNSGGPMVDKDGRLVGIATAVVLAVIDCSPDCTSEGSNLGLVRPISFALSLIEKKG